MNISSSENALASTIAWHVNNVNSHDHTTQIQYALDTIRFRR